jgi:hypothetical protein
LAARRKCSRRPPRLKSQHLIFLGKEADRPGKEHQSGCLSADEFKCHGEEMHLSQAYKEGLFSGYFMS